MSIEARLTREQVDALASLATALRPDHWVLIGATAVKLRVELARTTADVDCAVATPSQPISERLATAGWEPHQSKVHTWRRGRASVDVLQTTEDDLYMGCVSLCDGVQMSVVGLDLAYRECDRLPLRQGIDIAVPRLPILVLLKMVSWIDRPYDRQRDLGDILAMLEDGLAEDESCRFDSTHPVGGAGLDFDGQAPFFVGWQLGQLVETAHLALAKRFLDMMRGDESVGFAMLLRATSLGDEARVRRVRAALDAFERGLETGAREVEERAELRGVPPRVRPREFSWLAAGSKQVLLHQAIEQRRVVRFRYQGHLRIAEPHVLGTKNGKVQVQASQIGGSSSKGPVSPSLRGSEDWKRFTVEEMLALEMTDQRFTVEPRMWARHSSFDRYYAIVRRG